MPHKNEIKTFLGPSKYSLLPTHITSRMTIFFTTITTAGAAKAIANSLRKIDAKFLNNMVHNCFNGQGIIIIVIKE